MQTRLPVFSENTLPDNDAILPEEATHEQLYNFFIWHKRRSRAKARFTLAVQLTCLSTLLCADIYNFFHLFVFNVQPDKRKRLLIEAAGLALLTTIVLGMIIYSQTGKTPIGEELSITQREIIADHYLNRLNRPFNFADDIKAILKPT